MLSLAAKTLVRPWHPKTVSPLHGRPRGEGKLSIAGYYRKWQRLCVTLTNTTSLFQMSIPPAKHLINYMLFTGSLKKRKDNTGYCGRNPSEQGARTE